MPRISRVCPIIGWKPETRDRQIEVGRWTGEELGDPEDVEWATHVHDEQVFTVPPQLLDDVVKMLAEDLAQAMAKSMAKQLNDILGG